MSTANSADEFLLRSIRSAISQLNSHLKTLETLSRSLIISKLDVIAKCVDKLEQQKAVESKVSGGTINVNKVNKKVEKMNPDEFQSVLDSVTNNNTSALPTCDKNHTLVSLTPTQLTAEDSDYSSGYYCDVCGQSKNEISWHCSKCCYDLCTTCYFKQSSKLSTKVVQVQCNKQHELKWMSHGYRGGAYWCDVCGAKQRSSQSWHCKPCGYDLCKSCHETKQKAQSEAATEANAGDSGAVVMNWDVSGRCNKSHKLLKKTSDELVAMNPGYAGGSWLCDVCGQRQTPRAHSYHCAECGYDLCEACFAKYQQKKSPSNNVTDKVALKICDCIEYNELNDIEEILKYASNDKIIDLDFILNDWHLGGQLQHTLLTKAVVANNIPIVQLLISYKARADSVTGEDVPPLMYACFNDDFEMCKVLLANGAKKSVNTVTKQKLSCLRTVARNNNVKICKLLLEHNLDIKKQINLKDDRDGITPFMLACEAGSLKFAQFIVEIAKSDQYRFEIDLYSRIKRSNMNLLGIVVNNNQYQMLKFLIEDLKICANARKANYIDAPTGGKGETPLIFSAYYGNMDSVKLLHKHGCNIDAKTKDGISALYYASQRNKYHCVDYLINEANAQVNFATTGGPTALMIAARMGSLQSASILCKCDRVQILEPKDSNGMGAIEYAVYYGHVRIFQLFCSTLLKRLSIKTWKDLTASELLTSDKMTMYIYTAGKQKSRAMEKFLVSLKKNALDKENFHLLQAMIDHEGGDTMKQKIKEKCDGIRKDGVIARKLLEYIKQGDNSDVVLKNLNKAVNSMILEKQPINDCLMLVANEMDQNGLTKSLQASIKDSLCSEEKNERDYSWYKTCLLESGIWSLKVESGKLLFDVINNNVISIALQGQQSFIKNEVEREFSSDGTREQWNDVLLFKEMNGAYLGQIQQNELIMGQAFKNEKTDSDINFMAPEHGGTKVEYEPNQLFDDLVTGFNGMSAYDLNAYLTKLIICAQGINDQFQEDCQKVLNSDVLGVKCKFKSAPVKTFERSVIKSTTDYSDRPWPTTSSILDFVRCGVSFESPQDMYQGLLIFRNTIRNGGKAGCIKKIVRIKNMFSKVLDWRKSDNLANYSYCDIKFNVYIQTETSSMVGEIQFLLNWMSEAKNRGHSLYGFVRNEDFVQEVSNQYYESLNNQDSIKSEIANIIATKNFKRLEKQLLYGNVSALAKLKINGMMLQDLFHQNHWKKGLNAYNAALQRGDN